MYKQQGYPRSPERQTTGQNPNKSPEIILLFHGSFYMVDNEMEPSVSWCIYLMRKRIQWSVSNVPM